MADILANYVKFVRGTPTAYQNLSTKDENTLYFISEKNALSGTLYLGSKLISGGIEAGSIATSLGELSDVDLTGIDNHKILGYDGQLSKWIPMEPNMLLSTPVMVGATDLAAGEEGIVPAPQQGEQNYFLRGDGTWAPISLEDKELSVFEAITTSLETEAQLNELNEATKDKIIHNGDIGIVKVFIANDKYQYITYVYQDEWVALDSYYNAKSIYFDSDLLTTTAIGNITLTNGSATIEAKGKNLKEVFDTIFVTEENPNVTPPSVKISLSNTAAKEVGTTIKNLTYSATFEDGNYEFGPSPTGVEVNSWSITSTSGESYDEASGTLNEIVATDNMKFTVTATASYSEGLIPVTNLNNEYSDGQILAGSASATSTGLTSYRSYFYGADITEEAITSTLIRGLTNSNKKYQRGTLTWKASDTPGIKRFIFAAPADSNPNISQVLITSSLNANVTNEYVLQSNTVAVEGVNGYATKPYKVWVYQPASISNKEVHQITLG